MFQIKGQHAQNYWMRISEKYRFLDGALVSVGCKRFPTPWEAVAEGTNIKNIHLMTYSSIIHQILLCPNDIHRSAVDTAFSLAG